MSATPNEQSQIKKKHNKTKRVNTNENLEDGGPRRRRPDDQVAGGVDGGQSAAVAGEGDVTDAPPVQRRRRRPARRRPAPLGAGARPPQRHLAVLAAADWPFKKKEIEELEEDFEDELEKKRARIRVQSVASFSIMIVITTVVVGR